jgi:hypothetical protein
MPDRNDCVAIAADGSWSWFEPSATAEWPTADSRPLMSGYAYARQAGESKGWFAASVLECVDAYREAVTANKILWAAESHYQLGRLLERYWWKFNHEALAEDGYRMKDGRRRGAPIGAAAGKAAASERRDGIVVAAQAAWNGDRSLVGKYKRTARLLAAKPTKYFHPAAAALSVERMRKLINDAHKDGSLK